MEDQLNLHELKVNEHSIDMKLSGEQAKFFMMTLISFFEQNGGENYLTLTFEMKDKKYAVTIQDCYGMLSPAEKIALLEEKLKVSRLSASSLSAEEIQKFKEESERDMDILMTRYHIRYRTATEVVDLEPRLRTWFMKLLEMAYDAGKSKR